VYNFLDVGSFLKDYNTLKKRNEKLRAENMTYKQMLKDLNVVFARVINGNQRGRKRKQSGSAEVSE